MAPSTVGHYKAKKGSKCDKLAQVVLVPATAADQPIVANLLQFYIDDFSEIMPLELGPDGRFLYPELTRYWSEPALTRSKA